MYCATRYERKPDRNLDRGVFLTNTRTDKCASLEALVRRIGKKKKTHMYYRNYVEMTLKHFYVENFISMLFVPCVLSIRRSERGRFEN